MAMNALRTMSAAKSPRRERPRPRTGATRTTALTAALAMVAGRVRAVAPEASWISAGMSGDYVEAIAAGATHLRIGSAVTGPRNTAL